uniref:Metalloendopeptidase n=1 Tax=Bursaphelenchus xylophilus TaxID=6326 RepID=A0A1I7SBM6_BURXY
MEMRHYGRIMVIMLMIMGMVAAKDEFLFDEAVPDAFLLPQDFDLAVEKPVYRPSDNELEALENPDLFEGDILGIPAFDQTRLRDDPMTDEDRIFNTPFHSSLNVDTYADKLWNKGRIPYLLEEGMTQGQRAAIAQAFNEYRDKTCIRFVPKESDDYDYIYIKRNIAFGCSSYVGRAGGNQTVSLEVGKCFSKGIIAHELMHAIGFFHEHSRTDRDEYVVIDEGNIRPGMMRNFEKYPRKIIDPLGMPYDYESIMHYHKLAFSRNGRATIVPKNNSAEIGQRYKLSDIDAEKINKLYKCPRQRPDSSVESTTDIPDGSSGRISEKIVEEISINRAISSIVTVSTNSPTVLFTRTTSDRWKHLTDRYGGQRTTIATRPRTTTPESIIDPSTTSSEERTRPIFTTKRPKFTITNKVKTAKKVEMCLNLNAHCEMWERLGHCEHSAKYMGHYCRKACGLCVESVEFVKERELC